MKQCFPFLLTCLLFLTACGDSPEDKASKGINEALTLLSQQKCDKAIEVLEDLKEQEKNPVYLKTFASAYACKANFNMITFLESDIPLIQPNKLFKSLSTLTNSKVNKADSSEYVAMWKALEILGEGNDFKQSTRNSLFGRRHGEDMGVQLMIYSLVNFGRYLNWYGNVNKNGEKGKGGNTSTCYLNYTYSPAATAVQGHPSTNACKVVNNGHPDLNGAKKITRMCEGITLMTNIFDSLSQIDLSHSNTLSSLADIVDEFDDYLTAAEAAGLGYLLDLTSPAECEDLLANTDDLNKAELLFALLIEKEHE